MFLLYHIFFIFARGLLENCAKMIKEIDEIIKGADSLWVSLQQFHYRQEEKNVV